MLKKFWDWILDVDELRTKDVLTRSVSGKPLVELHSSLSGSNISTTPEGIRGATIAMHVTQVGDLKLVKQTLRREFDDYLSEDDYQTLLVNIETRLKDGGYSIGISHNHKGHLEFHRVPWNAQDKAEVENLIAFFRGRV